MNDEYYSYITKKVQQLGAHL